MRKKKSSESETERKKHWFKWRWEFMRRSKEYIKDWHDIKKQPAISKEKEIDLREKYGLWPLLNPAQSFEEIFSQKKPTTGRKNKTVDAWESSLNEFWIINSAPPAFEEIGTRECMFKGEVRFLKDVILQERSTESDFILHIDFKRVNSITAFKSALMDWVDMEWSMGKTYLRETHKEPDWVPGETAVHLELVDRERDFSVLSDIDYSKFIRIGDMKEKKNLNDEEIAREIWPGIFTGEVQNTEATIKYVGQCYKKYQRLVNGGYKKFSYT